jgi:hypothetical protein
MTILKYIGFAALVLIIFAIDCIDESRKAEIERMRHDD